jgi:hypothetical protein
MLEKSVDSKEDSASRHNNGFHDFYRSLDVVKKLKLLWRDKKCLLDWNAVT